MKKKIALTLIVVLIIGTMVGVLTGCDEIFKKNVDRDLNQVVASVNYKGQSSDVYKFEMIDTFNAYAPIYVQYYGMSYKEAASYVVKSLAERELLILFARDYIAEVNSTATEKVNPAAMVYYNDKNKAYSLLNKAEHNRAIELTNKDLLNALESAVKQSIQEDKANAGDDTVKTDDVYTGDVTNPVYINFDSVGGSAVPTKTVEAGKKTFEPTAPTKTGYTFFGWKNPETGKIVDWHTDVFEPKKDENGEVVSRTIKLIAQWESFTAPRTERPAAEEKEDEFDVSKMTEEEIEATIISPKFFTDEYKKTIDFKDKDFVKDIILNGETVEKKLGEYVDNALATLEKNLKKQNKGYDYFLESQYKTLVLAKLERLVKEDVTVDASEVSARYEEMVNNNKEIFGEDGKKFEAAFKSSFASSPMSVYKTVDNGGNKSNHGYGYVHNILIKLQQKDVDEIYQIRQDYGKKAAEDLLQTKIEAMTVKVSNPDYKANSKTYEFDETTKKPNQKKPIDLKDPMKDENNPYLTKKDNSKNDYYSKGSDYNKIISFEYVPADDQRVKDGKLEEGFQVVFNVHEAPAMAYVDKYDIPAFTKGEQIGVVEQIYNSFEQVKAFIGDATHPLTEAQVVYWLREVSNAWLYLVGDDSGALNTESNNGGLGYLVNPEGEESGFLEGFTAHARKLIDQSNGKKISGGVYSEDGSFEKSYVIDNNFIFDDEKVMPDKASAYAGVFVLLTTQTSYVPTEVPTEEGFHSVLIPKDYYVQYDSKADECLTFNQKLEKDLLEARKIAAYNEMTNKFGNTNKDNIEYFEKAYESIYKEIEKASK